MPGRRVDRANNLVHGYTSLLVHNGLNFAFKNRPVISRFIIFKCKYKYNSLAVMLVWVRIPGHECFNYSTRAG